MAEDTGAGGTPASKPWFEGADPALVGHIQNRGWHNLDPAAAAVAAATAHRGAEAHLGVSADRLLRLPAADDAEGMKAALRRLGAPESPDKYEFSGVKFKDGSEPEKDMLDFWRAAAHELNMPAGMARDMLARLVAHTDAAAEAEAASAATENLLAEAKRRDALQQIWGLHAAQNRFIAEQGARMLGLTAERADEIARATGDGYAATWEAFRQMGGRMAEPSVPSMAVGGGGQNLPMTPQQARARLDEIAKDKDWVAKWRKGDTAATREFEALTKALHGAGPPR